MVHKRRVKVKPLSIFTLPSSNWKTTHCKLRTLHFWYSHKYNCYLKDHISAQKVPWGQGDMNKENRRIRRADAQATALQRHSAETFIYFLAVSFTYQMRIIISPDDHINQMIWGGIKTVLQSYAKVKGHYLLRLGLEDALAFLAVCSAGHFLDAIRF